MAIETVRTLSNGVAHYRQSTPLDGQIFVLHFDYNDREGNWYLSVHDAEDVPILGCVGRKVVTNYSLLLRAYDDNRPLGELVVVSGTQDDAGLFDLGSGVTLTYVPLADAEALGSWPHSSIGMCGCRSTR